MTLSESRWTLVREKPDFSPLDFSQRFTGTLSQDGSVISGDWETSVNGAAWAHDFELRYQKME